MKNTNIERLGLRYGIVTAVTLIAFFFIMMGLGLVQQYELRILNIVFLLSGILIAVNAYRTNPKYNPNYLGGIGVGLLTSAVALLVFSTFVVIYLASNPVFMETLKSNEYFGRYLNPYIAGAVIFIEGTVSGLLTSFILMQFYKHSHLKASEASMP
jgi:hypothetical protein